MSDAQRRRQGPIERSVRAYLRSLSKQDQVLKTYAEMALRLARSYDGYDGVDLAKLARLNMELRQTLTAIAEVARGDDGDDGAQLGTPEWSEMPAPVRNSAQS